LNYLSSAPSYHLFNFSFFILCPLLYQTFLHAAQSCQLEWAILKMAGKMGFRREVHKHAL
jgi:hypothetical protein